VKAMFRGLLFGCAIALSLAPAASASITPRVALDQSGGTSAGTTVPLGMDLKFAPTGSDSPKDMTLVLPAGLVSDATVNHGKCLKTHGPDPKCQVGSGSVTASASGLIPVTLPIKVDLVAPPKPTDLAGLITLVTIGSNTQQLGTPGDVQIRPGTDPAGVGLNISFKNLPNTFSGASLSLDELKSTFAALRMPAYCPATPAPLKVIADSYSAPSTQRTASAPVHVTGCSKLAFSPSFSVSAVKDAHDSGVQIVTDVSQPASPIQATSKTVKLKLPWPTLASNTAQALGALCKDPTFASCRPIGSATTSSPLYPFPLSGKLFLTGSPNAPGISLIFPPPFTLRIDGTVDLANSTTTFHNVPDFPTSDLRVTLTGGPHAAFETNCKPPTGRATTTLNSTNGDLTAVASALVVVAGCKVPKAGHPKMTSARLTGLARRKPTLTFHLVAGSGAPKIASFAVQLPHGLTFRSSHRRSAITVHGGALRSVVLGGTGLVAKLRGGATNLSIKIPAKSLIESKALRAKARKHKLRKLKLKVVITNTTGNATTVTRKLTLH